MKKIDNKGFMLTELLVTATLVCTVLIFLYTQFYNVKKSYDNSFKYNTVNGLYSLANVREFLFDNDTAVIKQNLSLNSSYVDLKEDTTGINDIDYWNLLITSSNIKTIIFTYENLDTLISNLEDLDNTKEDLKKFIRRIDYDDSAVGYRLIVEYNDNTFATLLMGDE